MRVIGLTGGTGSGKGEVSKILKEKGAVIIDADEVAHDIIKKGKPAYFELVEYFGEKILDSQGQIIRRKLGELVFLSGGEKLEFLNKCTHKYIYLELEKMIEEKKMMGVEICVMDAPLLLEGDFAKLCQEIWVVYAEESVRLQRIVKRDGISQEHGKSRISAQKPWAEYKKFANVIIDNSHGLDNIKMQIDKYL